jgi:lipid II:glycine glycyltransferase (peptidoglycan interpeptide bridge formation enzyme)
MIELGPSYKQVGSLESAQGIIDYWVSSQTTDPEWDRLLATTDQGQYQQTAMWAGYKAGEGWNTHRIVCFSKGEWVGGCQCLWRSKGPIRIGYAIKGPVTRVYSDELATTLGAILLREVRRLGISLLVAQLPDSAPAESRALESLGFLRSNPFQVIQATCLIRTDDGTDEIRRRMNRSTKHHVNRARSRGVEIREGKESDLLPFSS